MKLIITIVCIVLSFSSANATADPSWNFSKTKKCNCTFPLLRIYDAVDGTMLLNDDVIEKTITEVIFPIINIKIGRDFAISSYVSEDSIFFDVNKDGSIDNIQINGEEISKYNTVIREIISKTYIKNRTGKKLVIKLLVMDRKRKSKTPFFSCPTQNNYVDPDLKNYNIYQRYNEFPLLESFRANVKDEASYNKDIYDENITIAISYPIKIIDVDTMGLQVENEIRSRIFSHLQELKPLFEKHYNKLKGSARFYGRRFDLDIRVGKNGSVTECSLSRPTRFIYQFEPHLLSEVKKWKFPTSENESHILLNVEYRIRSER